MSNLRVFTPQELRNMQVSDCWKNVFALTISGKISIRTSGSSGVDGADGADGNDGVDGNSILNGIVDPTTEGNDGDFYINTVTLEFFGPKVAGAWGVGTPLKGADGSTGGFTGLMQDSTGEIIGRFEEGLLKQPYFPSTITSGIGFMQIGNDNIVG